MSEENASARLARLIWETCYQLWNEHLPDWEVASEHQRESAYEQADLLLENADELREILALSASGKLDSAAQRAEEK